MYIGNVKPNTKVISQLEKSVYRRVTAWDPNMSYSLPQHPNSWTSLAVGRQRQAGREDGAGSGRRGRSGIVP